MKKLALTVLLAAAAAFGQQGETKKGPASQAHVLTSAEFDALLAHPDQLLIVDGGGRMRSHPTVDSLFI
jgi:hypothetical protein